THVEQSGALLLFFSESPALPQIYTLSLHDALPIWRAHQRFGLRSHFELAPTLPTFTRLRPRARSFFPGTGKFSCSRSQSRKVGRSEEHTSELQSLAYLVCRLLLEKKKKISSSRPPQ